jgi:hypothetical protein
VKSPMCFSSFFLWKQIEIIQLQKKKYKYTASHQCLRKKFEPILNIDVTSTRMQLSIVELPKWNIVDFYSK